MPKPRRCKDCPPDSKRPAPHPGPRCATCHRSVTRTRRAAAHERSVCKRYPDLKPGQYAALLEVQGGRCAICPRKAGRRRLAVDHDHATGKVRGLLCPRCNDAVAHFRDDPELFERGAAYLRRPPASSVVYGDSPATDAV